MVAERRFDGADSVYRSHSGSFVETSEDLKAKAESQMAEARRTEAQGQLTTDTADWKMTEDALAEDTAAFEDTTRVCQAEAVEFETATNGRSEELDAYAKAGAVISQKTGGAESFSYGLTQTSFLRLSRSVLSPSGGLTKFKAVWKTKELAKREHSFELARLASRVASAMHVETGEVNTHVQHVVHTVEVERPKIIKQTVQKPIIQEKINRVTKHVEVQLSQFTDKIVDIPVVVQRQIPIVIRTVQKTIEISQLQDIDEVVDVPVGLVAQVPLVRVVAETAEIPLVQFLDKVDDIPVVVPRQILPMAQTVQKTIEDTQLQVVVEKTTDDSAAAAQHQSTRQQHNNYHSKRAMQQRERKEEKGLGEREKGRKDEVGRVQEGGRKEKERKPEVKKDVTGWTVVTRNRRPRKMVQIFVKVNGSKATPMDVNLTDDKVEHVIRRTQNDEDVYVTMHGRVLKRGEKLKSYEVTDGCTIQVTSRLRGGGKHKDKKSKADTKRNVEDSGKKDQQVGSMSDKCQEMTKDQKDALIQTIERNEGYRKLITTISQAENWEHEIQCFRKQLQEQSGIEEERAKVMEWGMRWAVEARRRGRGAEQEQRRQEEERQRRHEEQGENTGRGSAGLVRGGDERCQTDETSRKGKGKGNGGKGEHDGKAGGAGSKGRRQVENLVMDEGQENMRAKTSEENHEEDMRKLLEMVEREEMELEMMQQEEMEHEEQRGRVAPNMGQVAHTPRPHRTPERRRC